MQELQAITIPVTAKEIPPSLEDVFIALVGKADKP